MIGMTFESRLPKLYHAALLGGGAALEEATSQASSRVIVEHSGSCPLQLLGAR